MMLRRWLLALLVCACLPAMRASAIETVTLDSGYVLAQASTTPPAATAPWEAVRLPHSWLQSSATGATALWYRFDFQWPHGAAAPSALYIPYLNDGGTLYLNGAALGDLPHADLRRVVRWERPHLLAIPPGQLLRGANTLLLRTTLPQFGTARRLPSLAIGDVLTLRSWHDQRQFWVRTAPQITTAAALLMSLFLLLIWWRRRQEVLYGILGAVALLWGARTFLFLSEQLTVEALFAWRVLYHATTGGFTVVLALFSIRFSNQRRPWIERGLLLYWAIGPLALLIDTPRTELLIGFEWTAGLLLIALAVFLFAAYAAWRQRTWQALSLCIAMSMIFVAGVHDYLLFANSSLLPAAWLAQRYFLLHHAANLLLLTLAGILTSRFVATLNSVEDINASLELRIAEREAQLAANFQELVRLNGEHAATAERQRLARDMHDGLGSQLFTSLSRVERTLPSQPEMLDMLRSCIAEMRLAMDTLAPQDEDFLAVLGNFRYRWEAQLAAAQIASRWRLEALQLPTRQRLQVLRILQEALTNVVKHAHAQSVQVEAVRAACGVRFSVSDDGCGAPCPLVRSGRGLDNMRVRAQQLGGELSFESSAAGTRVTLLLANSTSLQ